MSAPTAAEKHLAQVTEATIMELAEGANFIVICPGCEAEWALAVSPLAGSALANTYGDAAIESRFRKLEADRPLARCGTCIFRGEAGQ